VYDAAFQVNGAALISRGATTRETARQLAISHTGSGNWGLNLGYVYNPGVEASGVIQALDGGNPASLYLNPSGGKVYLGWGSEVIWGDYAFSRLSPDQGGSIELGNSVWSPSLPYIDFHFNVGFPQDFNVRLQNDGDNVLTCSGNFRALTLTPTSDRNAKENFKPVDARAVLEKVTSLPLSEWNFKADSATRHLGPMAQDFYAAFGVGPDEKHIATVDADGVALAAIQGLNQKVEAETAALRAENAALRRELAGLKQFLQSAGK
jgi:hypothetical protein